MQANRKKIIVLGTGGTIAGLATDPAHSGRYRSAQLGVETLMAGISLPPDCELQVEQVAQIDSKDMSCAVWQALLGRCRHSLAQPDVMGVVITHGTDTLEETAWLLQSVLAPDKPVVLTCAMRPANAPDADGPRNLRDALVVAAEPRVRGVLVVCAGQIHGARDVQKVHTSRLDAFGSGDGEPWGRVEDGRVRQGADWPAAGAGWPDRELDGLLQAPSWPRVEIVFSHALAGPDLVDALLDKEATRRRGAPPVRGLVAAGTGSGTLHEALEQSLLRAMHSGVRVVRATRCPFGPVPFRQDDPFGYAQGLSPVKARIDLMLELARTDVAGERG